MKKKVRANKQKSNNFVGKKLWFRAKCYGFGWYPATWQGWIVLIIWAILFILIVGRIDTNKNVAFNVVLPAILVTVALIIVCYLKGEKPCWRWGSYS